MALPKEVRVNKMMEPKYGLISIPKNECEHIKNPYLPDLKRCKMKKITLLLITTVLSLSAVSLDDKVAYLNNVQELIIMTQKMRGGLLSWPNQAKTDRRSVGWAGRWNLPSL